jgi:predicted phosphodiesterase
LTRWGLSADVHGNLPLLERAREGCRGRGAERYVFLGDLLGGAEPAACVALARRLDAMMVIGNRDLDWQHDVDEETRAFVLSLPRHLAASDFVAAHGDARLVPRLSTAEIGREFRRAYPWLREQGKRVGFFGHSHNARVWRKDGAHAPAERLRGARVSLDAHPETVFLVNVGTTGLPFPGKGPPSCAVYDDVERWVEHHALGPGRGRPLELNG